MKLPLRAGHGVALLGAAAFALTLACVWFTTPRAAGREDLPPVAQQEAENPAATDGTLPVADTDRPEAPVATAPDVDELLAGAVGPVAATRLTSIEALAGAPRSRAVPVLVQISRRGEAGDERMAALHSLQAQAERNGDSDDAIHGLLRELIHDGNDEDVTARAQQVLERIDAGTAR